MKTCKKLNDKNKSSGLKPGNSGADSDFGQIATVKV